MSDKTVLSDIIEPSPIKHLSSLTFLPIVAFFRTTQSNKEDVSCIETFFPIEHLTDEEVLETPSPYHELRIFFLK